MSESNTYKVDERFYKLEDLDSDDDDEVSYASVPQENLVSAASFVVTIIRDATIPCAVLGGLAVALNGIDRETRDVDIGVLSKNWRAIRAVLETHIDSGRLKIPKSKLVADYLRIFCRTGAPWDACQVQHEVEVVLLSKPNAKEQDLDSSRNPPVFTLPALFRFKLLAYNNRKAQRDLDDMDSILRKTRKQSILERKSSFRNIDVQSDVIEEIGDEYADLKQVLRELLL